MKKCKLLLFDLDGTLLQSDKTISTRTLSALKKCRGNDILIGVSTSRSEQNSLVFLNELMPDILISSGGALVKYKTEYIYRAEFSEEETNVMIDMARNICGNDCEITIDTIDAHYWNYKIDPKKLDKSCDPLSHGESCGKIGHARGIPEMRSELLCVQSFFSRDDWYGICGVWQSDSHTTHGGAVDLQRYVSGGDFAGCGDEFCKLLHSFI